MLALPARCGPTAPRAAHGAAHRRRQSAPRAASGTDEAAEEQQRTPLVDALRLVAADGAAPFHVPGHQARNLIRRDIAPARSQRVPPQRGQGAPPALRSLLGAGTWSHDLTELDGLDYLSAPRGAIGEAQALAARAFGAGRTWFLVNGTTVGVHAAVLAAARPGDAVVLGRNCHASALAACALAGVVPFFAEAPADEALGIAPREPAPRRQQARTGLAEADVLRLVVDGDLGEGVHAAGSP